MSPFALASVAWEFDPLLQRLEVERREPSPDYLQHLHRAFVSRVPYETVDIQLGRPPGIDPLESVRHIVQTGRGGYCYTLNGAFAALLLHLGFDCTLHVGGVQRWGGEALINANHVALTVRLHGAQWYCDVGTGDALYDPLPLEAGEYRQEPFRYCLRPSGVEADAWRLDHDERGAFAGLDFSLRPANIREFTAQHQRLSTSSESGFVRSLSMFRRRPEGVDILRSLQLSSTDATGQRVLSTCHELFEVMVDVFGLGVADLDEQDRARLWTRARTAHEQWLRRSDGA